MEENQKGWNPVVIITLLAILAFFVDIVCLFLNTMPISIIEPF